MTARWPRIEAKDKRHKWVVPENRSTGSVMAKCSACGKKQRVLNSRLKIEPSVGRFEGVRFLEV